MTNSRELVMTISLNALEHLGLNLYSNIPAVLSEVVANAWDADAKKVKVTIDKKTETITIEDDGTGMDRDGVIDRFLTVSFKRRDELGETTALKRKPMGRKGIGKLSIFSVAQVADVFTAAGDGHTAFKMDREAIKQAIAGKGEGNYKPEELDKWPDDFTVKTGTRIVLSKISKSLSKITVDGLKRRVARRFSVIGAKNNFVVEINGDEIGPEDRGYHNFLQHLWIYGNQDEFACLCKNLEGPWETRLSTLQSELEKAGISLSGWIGTVTSPKQLKDEEGDNLNRITIFMRGKMAQEDILGTFGQKEIYADYIIGELHCEELDVDSRDDIATSSRQSIKEDDPRFEALRKVILSELRYIASKWNDLRRADGVKIAVSVPAVSDWLNSLQGDTKKKAERWIGRLNTIRANDKADKRELLKASILAFETYRRKEELDHLENIKDESLDQVLEIFENIDDLETSYYGQIVQGRLKVITTLKNQLEKDAKEQIIRDYLFEHLWLLDPSWERVKGSEHMETQVNKFLKEDSDSLTDEERRGRIDIGYRTTAGKHVIIELKRASVSVPIDKLTGQIRKYRDGARKILKKTEHSGWPIEIICLVGCPPPEWEDAAGTGQTGVEDALKGVNARIVFYDQLLGNAESAYADYLKEHAKTDRLWGIFEAIDNFAPYEE